MQKVQVVSTRAVTKTVKCLSTLLRAFQSALFVENADYSSDVFKDQRSDRFSKLYKLRPLTATLVTSTAT